jgi:hypothetical protein
MSKGVDYNDMAQGRSIRALLAPGAMNAVLNANDLRAVGLQPSVEQPKLNSYEENVYATWLTRNGGRGDVELDLMDAGTEDPAAVVRSVLAEAGGDGEPTQVQLVGAEDAYFTQTEESAGITARRGTLVIALDIPGGPQSAQQVYQLAGLVVQRLAA